MNDERPTRGFQFGLRGLILAMVVLSAVFSQLFADPDDPGWMVGTTAGVVTILWAVALAVFAVYGRGSIRESCIGAIIPATIAAVFAACLVVADVLEPVMTGFLAPYRLSNSTGYVVRFILLLSGVFSCIFGTISAVESRLSRDE